VCVFWFFVRDNCVMGVCVCFGVGGFVCFFMEDD
jgi:hypothetical protein